MTVTLSINGKNYEGWKTAQVTTSMENLSGGFVLNISERWSGQDLPREINPGDSCTLKLDGETVITGYVDKVDPAISADDHTLQITGRDKAGDLVDCSIIHSSGQISGKRMEEIVKELIEPFGMTVETEVDTGEVFKKFNIQQGETVHEAIQRMAKMRAVLVLSDKKGGLLITRAGSAIAAADILEGQGGNLKTGSSTNSHAERFSYYLTKGQDQGNDHVPAKVFTSPKGAAVDSDVNRYRPLLVVAEGKSTIKTCQDRAAWEKANRKGKGLSADIAVVGWRNKNGQIWEVNSLAKVNSVSLKINEQMLISEVNFSLDQEGGTITNLKLVRPETYKLIPEPEQA